MYENVGKRIMLLAKVLSWIALAAGIIVWLYFITNGYEGYWDYEYITHDDWIGWLGLISGILFYISSWIVYGFGQIVDDVNAMRNSLTDDELAEESDDPSAANQIPKDIWVCKSCGSSNSRNISICQECGITKAWSDANPDKTTSGNFFKDLFDKIFG